jgi:hypothetical protein
LSQSTQLFLWEETKLIDPEMELDAIERGDLSMVFHSKGWAPITKILRVIVEEARVAVDNAQKDDDVLSAQKLSRAAGIVVTKFFTRVQQEVGQHVDLKKNAEPVEGAPGLEMDDIAGAVEHLPNLLGEAYISEDDTEEGRL